MTKASMACWLCIAMLLSISNVRGQNFDYSFSAGTGTYQNLPGATALTSGNNWCHSRFKIPIGFAFDFNGASFDSLTIEANGFVKFSNNNAIVLFQGSGCKADSNNAYSLLSYTSTGTAGSRILKIQYTNCGYDKNNISEQLSYQLWLYEQSDKVEIHTGSNSYPGAIDSTGVSPTPLIGLINPMQDAEVNGLLISGSATSPSSQPLNQGGELYYVDFVPPSNRIYIFTPNGN